MSCNPCNSCNNTIDDCGCDHEHSGACVFYHGGNLTCPVTITNGQDYDTIIKNINAYLCTLTPSGQVTYVVTGCSNIDVTTSTVGNTTTYNVCIDSAITDQITNNTTNIATLQTCCDESVKEITTGTPDSLVITNPSDGIWNINYQTPSSVTYDGIIYNNITPATLPNGSGGSQLIKSYQDDYANNFNIQDGDEIRFTVTGRVRGSGTDADSIIIDIFDANTATILSTSTFSSFNNGSGVISSYLIKGELTVDLTNSGGLLTLNLFRNLTDEGMVLDHTRDLLMVDDYFTGTDWTSLSVRVRQLNSSLQSATDNNVRKLMVEVRKKII